MRYPTRMTWWILPVFLLMGVTRGRCFTEVSDDDVRVKLGWLFDHTYPRSTIRNVQAISIPWYCGPGVHLDFRGRTFVTGDWGEGVELEFAPPQTVGGFFGRKGNRVVVTPRAADALIAALTGVTTPGSTPPPA